MNPISEDELGIERLSAKYNLSLFDSGSAELDDFLKNDALKEQQELLSKTHLCFYKNHVAGFITLTADSIRVKKDKLDESQIVENCEYPAYPCILIARLGIDRRVQKPGIGKFLLLLVIGLALEGPLGCRYLSVDPKTDALEYYKKFGFNFWTSSKRRMYLNIRDVARELSPDESLDPWITGE
jgi:GNAT superfamily N-acetyltransferase